MLDQLLDHVVSNGEECRGHVEAERLSAIDPTG
jgi:hypothetical protein